MRRGTLGRRALRPGAAAPVGAAFRDELEAQGAGDRRRLDQPHGDRIAESVGYATAIADHGVAVLVVAEIFVAADGARRNEAVGAGVVELDEQAGAGGAGDVTLEGGADSVGKKMGEQP